MANNRCSIALLDNFEGIYTDYYLAKHLGKKSSYIANIRAHRQHLPNWAIIELAKLGDFDPELWILWISADRASTDDEHRWWRSYMGRKANKAYAMLQSTAACISIVAIATICANGFDSVAYAFALPLVNIHYAYIYMCNSSPILSCA